MEQALFLLFGALRFLRQQGYLLNTEHDQYEKRWLHIVRAVDPMGSDYTPTMNRQLLSMFKDFYMGRTNRYSVGGQVNVDADAQVDTQIQSESDELIDLAIKWNDKGCDYLEDGNMTDAIECFQKAIEIFPEYAEAYCNLANCYDDLGLFDQSIETYEIATKLSIDPDRAAKIWENMGIAYSRKGNHAKAKQCSEMAMRKMYEGT
jgi:tetratricopeptide (TPR) repeat protein